MLGLLPLCFLKYQISGQFVNTQDALYQVTSKLRNNIFTIKNIIPETGNSKLLSDASIHEKVGDATPIDLHRSFRTSQFTDSQTTSSHGMKHLWHPSATRFQLSEVENEFLKKSYAFFSHSPFNLNLIPLN